MINWSAVGAICTILLFGYMIIDRAIGRGAERQTLGDHGKRLDIIEPKVEDLGNRMTASEAWREGYNAARRGVRE